MTRYSAERPRQSADREKEVGYMGLLHRIDAASFTPLGEEALPAPTAENGHGNGMEMTSATPPAEPASRTSRSTVSNTARTASISRDLKNRVKNRLIAELDPDVDLWSTAEGRDRSKILFYLVFESEVIGLTRVVCE